MSPIAKRNLLGVVLAALLALLVVVVRRKLAGPTVEDARAFYAAQPRYLQPVPYSPVPAGLRDASAETCGQCHPEIYAEWKISTHARAWLDDAQFQEELAKTRKTPGRDAGWMCVNCHTPMEAQLEQLVTGLVDGDKGRPIYVPNPNFDPKLQLEAITCGTCHLRDGVVLGPYGDTQAPHPVQKAPELLTEAVCTQCHQAEAQFSDVELACFFNTGQELASGPYKAEGYVCQTCHMPEVERSLTNLGTPKRKTRRHWFGGSLIPKHPKFAAELEPLQAHYPDGLSVRWVDLPASVTPGAEVTLTLELKNAEAGHLLPTGDPERFITVHAEVQAPDGSSLASHDERLGAVYRWDPPIEKLSDNRLAPREARTIRLSFTAPSAGPLTLVLEADKWRLTQENLDYHQLEGRSVAGRPFLRERASLAVEEQD